jgi:hypothetical protein
MMFSLTVGTKEFYATQAQNIRVFAAQFPITPPPKHTSPSYNTADCPGVTAHWGWGNVNAKSVAQACSSVQGASAWR